jgi:uncharacterized protein YqeY
MIKQTIDQDLKTAMLAGDKQLVLVLRGLKSVILYGEVADGSRDDGMGDEDIIALFQKEYKKRSDAIELYDKAGEREKSAQERYEQEIINHYLPRQLADQEVEAIINKVIEGLPETPTMQSMGVIMSAIKEKTKGAADGALIAKLVKEKISQ